MSLIEKKQTEGNAVRLAWVLTRTSLIRIKRLSDTVKDLIWGTKVLGELARIPFLLETRKFFTEA